MASYSELMSVVTSSAGDALKIQVRVGVVIAANTIANEGTGVANHAARLIWAKQAVTSPDSEADKMLWALLAQNAAVPLSTILSVSDATVQTAINAAVNLLAQ
jgi:hypothetical protein